MPEIASIPQPAMSQDNGGSFAIIAEPHIDPTAADISATRWQWGGAVAGKGMEVVIGKLGHGSSSHSQLDDERTGRTSTQFNRSEPRTPGRI